MWLVLNGGEGDDIIIGSDGDDFLFGGPGNDVIIGGLGNDVIDGGDGDDIEIQSFTAGGGSEDAIDFSGHGYTFEWLIAHRPKSTATRCSTWRSASHAQRREPVGAASGRLLALIINGA